MKVFVSERMGGLSRVRGCSRAGELGPQADNQPRLTFFGKASRAISAESKS